MGLLSFLTHYSFTLLNAWVGWAGLVLGLNEIGGRFAGWSWEWPRQHRFKAIVALLLIAQVGAHKEQQDQFLARVAGLESAKTVADAELTKLRAQRDADGSSIAAQLFAKEQILATKDNQIADRERQLADRDRQLADKDRQIADLQAMKLRQPTSVDVRLRTIPESGPLPRHPLASDFGGAMRQFSSGGWARRGDIDVSINWDDMIDVDAVVDLVVLVTGKGSGALRLRETTQDKSVVARAPIVQSEKPLNMTMPVPRDTGLKKYRLEAATLGEDTQISVTAFLTLVRHKRQHDR